VSGWTADVPPEDREARMVGLKDPGGNNLCLAAEVLISNLLAVIDGAIGAARALALTPRHATI